MTRADTPRRLRIDRLELDLRGLPPATAKAAVRALGPAFAQALARGETAGAPTLSDIAPARRIDAGRVKPAASVTAHDLAAGIARRVTDAVRRRPE